MAITVQTPGIHTNVYLSKIAVNYAQDQFMWDKLMPPFPVKRESDKFKKYKKDGYFKGAPKRADGAPAEEASLSYTWDTYSCYERALKDIVTDRAVANADNVFNLKADTVKFLTSRIKLGMEIDVMEILTKTDGSGLSSGHYSSPSNKWDDYTNSDPQEDIRKAKIAISKATGRLPNVIYMSPEVESHLAAHTKIKELVKYTSRDALTKGGLPATLWDLTVVVCPAVYNTAEEGLSVNMDYVWSDNVIIAYVNPADTVTLGRVFVHTKRNMVVHTWRDEEREGEWIRVLCNYDPKIICPDAGYLLYNVLS